MHIGLNDQAGKQNSWPILDNIKFATWFPVAELMATAAAINAIAAAFSLKRVGMFVSSKPFLIAATAAICAIDCVAHTRPMGLMAMYGVLQSQELTPQPVIKCEYRG